MFWVFGNNGRMSLLQRLGTCSIHVRSTECHNKKGVSTITNQKTYSISCDPVCNFAVQSHDEAEALSIALAHAVSKHRENKMNAEDMKKSMQIK